VNVPPRIPEGVPPSRAASLDRIGFVAGDFARKVQPGHVAGRAGEIHELVFVLVRVEMTPRFAP